MLYLAWDREINISLFFCDVFLWKWGLRPRTSSHCYHGNKSAATFKKGIFVHPPWVLNCMQNLKGVENFHFLSSWFLQRLVLKCISSSLHIDRLPLWIFVSIVLVMFYKARKPHMQFYDDCSVKHNCNGKFLQYNFVVT